MRIKLKVITKNLKPTEKVLDVKQGNMSKIRESGVTDTQLSSEVWKQKFKDCNMMCGPDSIFINGEKDVLIERQRQKSLQS